MLKLLLLAAIVLLAWWLLKPRSLPPQRPRPPTSKGELEDMVACAYCGTHLPRSEALPGRGGLFCGEQHRALHEAARSE